MKHWKKIILCTVITALVLLILDIGRYFFYPHVSELAKNNPGKTAFMKYREKIWRSKGIDRSISATWVPLSQVSPFVVKAVIIAEDDKFWSHEGFDFEAMQKALEKDIQKKTFKAGGSTISQQLAKNLYLTPAKNPIRKIKEAILTWRIENHLTKRRILELYLNVAEWGDGLFGIEAAARRYYRKPAKYLNAREASTLAAALPNPRRFQPKGKSRYAANRAERIYRIMLRRGMVIPAYRDIIGQNINNDHPDNAPASAEKQSNDTIHENENQFLPVGKESKEYNLDHPKVVKEVD
jgi:monofunctional glycosyltransferase